MFNTEESCLKFYLLIKPSEKARVQNRLYELAGKRILGKSGDEADGMEGFWECKSTTDFDAPWGTLALEIRKTGASSYKIRDIDQLGEHTIMLTYTNENSIKFVEKTTVGGSAYSSDYSCELTRNKLNCINLQEGKEYKQTYVKRSHCEVVDDEDLRPPILCK